MIRPRPSTNRTTFELPSGAPAVTDARPIDPDRDKAGRIILNPRYRIHPTYSLSDGWKEADWSLFD
jgi:hypothetical protein